MNRRHFVCLTAFLPCFLFSTATWADVPFLGGQYQMAYQGEETLTLTVTPDGNGPSLDQAFLPSGFRADATITLYLWDMYDRPIVHYPAEDLWLESQDGGMVFCPAGTIADMETDIAGRTQWREPLVAGGHSQALTQVLINGSTPDLTRGLPLSFNSPDINGDLIVNFIDLHLFAQDYFGGYDFRSDFFRDGKLDGMDLMTFVRAYGETCP